MSRYSHLDIEALKEEMEKKTPYFYLAPWIVNSKRQYVFPKIARKTAKLPKFPLEFKRPQGTAFYIVESERGVKFGVSDSPVSRVRTHAANASHFGVEIGDVWISDYRGTKSREIESKLKRDNGASEFASWSFEFACTKAEILLGPGVVYSRHSHVDLDAA